MTAGRKMYAIEDPDEGLHLSSRESLKRELVYLFTPADLKAFAEEIWKAAGEFHFEDKHETFADYWEKRKNDHTPKLS